MTLLCVTVAAARSYLVVVTASVKGYQKPMTVLIHSGASLNFATKASVAKNTALYASALEGFKSNTNVCTLSDRVHRLSASASPRTRRRWCARHCPLEKATELLCCCLGQSL
ncbi:hypothetical protein PR003_g8209 [Phytophthora rubi]|uniref:Uncharacterized protein n=1 Tax=Phytophthora rubi TaxID=129364 RepID=A0A6A3N390_9STRA|nr:hypothetical protein PR002_g7941 [Phytophthora rubi]KAE9039210.1 hypothetical protein PR001_g7610 [Phytophthora rubi]KAE9344926.1 hypothetical protein PR003_g8209 [Phytophthora rubi]